MRLISAFAIAFSTYSKIPMPQVDWSEENKRYSMCFFPLIGAAVGVVLVAWLWLCELLNIGDLLRGAVGAVIPLLVTGGIHMDGFMDTMDAMASWQPKERRLEILKDSHTGAFAVIGCAAYLLAMAGAVSELDFRQGWAIATCYVLSRALSALALTWLPKARKTGMLSSFAEAVQKRAVTVVCAAYVVICAALLAVNVKLIALPVLAAYGLCFLYYRHFSMKYFGGVTGDLAGWFVQVSELAALLIVAIGGKIL